MANAKRAAAEAVVPIVAAEAAPMTSTALPARCAFSLSCPLLLPHHPCSDSDKKLHNGWGGDDGNTELKVEEAATVDAAAESAVVNDWGAPAEADATAGGWDAPAPDAAQEQSSPDADKTEAPRRKDRDQEEEDNTLTLDQYLAQQKENELGLLPKLETRKANDGQDAIWDGVTRLEKAEGEAYFSGKVLLSLPSLSFTTYRPLPDKISPKGAYRKERKGLYRNRSPLRAPFPRWSWRSWR